MLPLKKREDGTLLLRAREELDKVASKTGEWLNHWANETPDQIFIAERSGLGWREENISSDTAKGEGFSVFASGTGHE